MHSSSAPYPDLLPTAPGRFFFGLLGITLLLSTVSCSGLMIGDSSPLSSRTAAAQTAELPALQGCQFIEAGYGPVGATPLKIETVASGLEIPWAIGFLPDGDLLFTERAGRLRKISDGNLLTAPVVTIPVSETGEGGLLGLAVDPQFESNRRIYLYFTRPDGGNNLARYRMNPELTRAEFERTLLDDIPSAPRHDGGRIRFGPDGYLYVSTGDASNPALSQNAGSRAGKILRVSPEDGVTENFVLGVRNVQAFDWWDDSTLIIADHGPSGEFGLTGRDEISVAQKGANLGWPEITACETRAGFVTPFISWRRALPPGGAIVYRGNTLPSFKNSILVTALGGQHLHRVAPDGTREVYLSGENGQKGYGRLREIMTAPDGSILITTSNCDGRGNCGASGDLILRITP